MLYFIEIIFETLRCVKGCNFCCPAIKWLTALTRTVNFKDRDAVPIPTVKITQQWVVIVSKLLACLIRKCKCDNVLFVGSLDLGVPWKYFVVQSWERQRMYGFVNVPQWVWWGGWREAADSRCSGRRSTSGRAPPSGTRPRLCAPSWKTNARVL